MAELSIKNILEFSIIGTVLKSSKAYFEIEKDFIEDYFSEQNKPLVKEMVLKLSKGDKVNIVTICVNLGLKSSNIELIKSYADSEHIFENVKSLKEKYHKDLVYSILDEAKMSLENEEAIIAVAKLTKSIDAIFSSGGEENKHISHFAQLALDAILNAKDCEGLIGSDTGFSELNNLLGGWLPAKQVVIAARPGMGKTTVLLDTIRKQCRDEKKGILFNLEMTAIEILFNFYALEAGVKVQDIRSGNLTDDDIVRIREAFTRVSKWNLWIYDSMVSVEKICTEIRIVNRKEDLSFAAVDYLQLCRTSQMGSREQQVSGMSRDFKLIGKPEDCNLTTFILSQLSRAVEQRGGDKRPMLSDLRESGAIEQDADIILFPYRPAYYDVDMDDIGTPSDLTELIVAKNRGGSGLTSTVDLKFTAHGFVPYENFTEPTQNFTEPTNHVPSNMVKLENLPNAGMKPSGDIDDIPF